MLARVVVACLAVGCGGKTSARTAAPPADDVARCEAADGDACMRLGSLNEPSSDGGGGNAQLAFAYFNKACDRKVWSGCHSAARMYERGTGTPKDEGAAGRLYDLACANGRANSCSSRAYLYNHWLRGCNPASHDTSTYRRPRDCKSHVVATSQKMLEALRKACSLENAYCDVTAAYDKKPGAVVLKDGDARLEWHFETVEPNWDKFEQRD
jgi:TPR repeat protein